MPGSAPVRKGSSSSSADTPPTKRVKHSGGRDESSDGSCSGGGASGTSPYGSSATSTSSSSINVSGDAPAAAVAVAAGASTADGHTTMDVAQQRASGYDQQTAATGDANVSSATSAAAAVPPQPLLCRWEEIMLADTLRFSLDPAVARAKRVLHLGELEKELREEAPQDKPWSLDSRTLFDRLVFGRLNHTDLGRIGGGGGVVGMDDEKDAVAGSPLAYMVASYERAVQVGKGPAPRSKGISVGEKRDAALRHLREVLVSYAILTIQNPDMWGDDNDKEGSRPTPTDELKSLFKQKGAAALPQGLFDDFIRRAGRGSSSGARGGEVVDDEEVTLEDLFQPLLLSLLREAKELVARPDPTASAGEFATVVQALAALVERKPLAGLFARLPEWIPQTACSGKVLEEKSPLGILFAFKATRACFEVGAMDLVVSGAEWSRERKATREEGQALGTVLKSCRTAMSTVRGALLGLLTTLLKAKQAREPVLQWLAAVANHNRSRERDGFHQGFEDLPVSSGGMLANVLWALLKLCEPFLTLGDPKAEALAAKTDLDYFHGSDRIDVSDDTVLWSEDAEEATEEGSSGDGGTSSSRRWIDQRNESRRAQFEAARATMLSLGGEPTTGSGVGSEMEDVGEEEHEEVDPKEKTFGTTAEFAGLAARVLHVGVGQAQRLFSATNRKMERWREARNEFKRHLEEEAESRSDHERTLERRVKLLQRQLEAGALTRLTLQLVDMDPDIVLPSLRFLRFQGGRLMKHASVGRGVTRNALGEPVPPLPMPPPPRFAALPAHLMEDVADMIKFAAYTCPPDPRTGLPPLDLISPPEASAFLSFLVLFLGTSGYMRNPYIRAKMVEALVAFMPAEEEKGRPRRGKDPFESLFLGHPMARELLGPQLFEFFVDIELTGSHTQFYDKFTFRSLTAQLLEYLWTLQPYRESIIRYSEDSNKFVRFANMLINDSIYHTDEAIKFLSAIKVAQHRAADESLSEDERKEARDEAEHAGRSAKYCLKEATLLLRMLAYLSESIKNAFMVDELRARTAQMLGYFLDHLVGKKGKDLKVDNMAELGWRPREVLGTLVDIYIKLSTCERFAEAVAADERSYKREIFVRAGDVISRVPSDGSPVCEPRVVQAFRAFADTVEEKHVELSREFEELGDIPDRFMCPIGCDIMRDPVTLPTSGQVMDRQSITRHLLSDPQDPFSRKPLTVEMLEPNDALREEIEEWIREQRRRAKEEKVSRREGDTKGGDEKASSPADALPPPPPPAEKRDTSPPASEHSAMDVPSDGGAQAGDGSEGLPDKRSSRDSGGGEHEEDNEEGDRDHDDDDLSDSEEALLLQQALALSLEGAISGGGGDDGGQKG